MPVFDQTINPSERPIRLRCLSCGAVFNDDEALLRHSSEFGWIVCCKTCGRSNLSTASNVFDFYCGFITNY